MSVVGQDGNSISSTYESEYRVPWEDVFSEDFNQDDAPDFVAIIGNNGNGLAATLTDVVFCLSSNGQYEISSISRYYGDPLDMVRFKSNGPWYFISSDLVSTYDIDTKRPNHNFWLYQLYSFEGSHLVETTNIKRFPKFVWYTHKKNHRETTRLTPEEKKRLLEVTRLKQEQSLSDSRERQTNSELRAE